ncbi:hypothetical protein J2Y48_002496 [Mycoplana sp. BE70]|uniref:hypothetical protein n=1 Tax=Mycoplana sp. BE70 TaxID=2817775 RepID=UPI00285B4961|nr:hypothetical protein [Mycoplana sp. BE70]MDR6757200.1 hypothetical protein [Mycoplana sp. BE70]
MSKFNDSIRERLRLQRLNGLRDRLMRGSPDPIYPEEFKAVFTDMDFLMIDRMWEDYKYRSHYLQKAHELAPDHVKAVTTESMRTAHSLSELHLQWRKVFADLKMDDSERRLTLSRICESHEGAMRAIPTIKEALATLSEHDLRFIQRPVELPEVPLDETMSKHRAFTDHELSRRYDWFYRWRDKFAVNGLPSESMALKYLFLWQLESHLALPERTGQDDMGWYPACSFGA